MYYVSGLIYQNELQEYLKYDHFNYHWCTIIMRISEINRSKSSKTQFFLQGLVSLEVRSDH